MSRRRAGLDADCSGLVPLRDLNAEAGSPFSHCPELPHPNRALEQGVMLESRSDYDFQGRRRYHPDESDLPGGRRRPGSP